MSDKSQAHNAIYTEAVLLNSSPEFAYQWLKDRSENDDLDAWDRDASLDSIEHGLLKINDPLINLGLARYGCNAEAVRSVYDQHASTLYHKPDQRVIDPANILVGAKSGGEKYDQAIRIGALSNPVIGDPSLFLGKGWITEYQLKKVVESDSHPEIFALGSNPKIPCYLLEAIYSKTRFVEGLDDNKWLICVGSTIDNPRIIAQPRKSNSLSESLFDIPGKYEAEKSCWELAKNAPVTKDWAYVLTRLFEKLPRVNISYSQLVFTDELKRWNVEPHKEGEKYPDYFEWVRILLVGLLKEQGSKQAKVFDALKDSDDWAVRMGFYRNFICKDPEELNAMYEKDGLSFLEHATANRSLYLQAKIRNRLLNLCDLDKETDYHLNAKRSFYSTWNYLLENFPDIYSEKVEEEPDPEPLLTQDSARETSQQKRDRHISQNWWMYLVGAWGGYELIKRFLI